MPRTYPGPFTGDKVFRLTVLRVVTGGRTMIECQCDCGTTTTVDARDLRLGYIKSCGCWRAERNKETETEVENLIPGFFYRETFEKRDQRLIFIVDNTIDHGTVTVNYEWREYSSRPHLVGQGASLSYPKGY